MFDVPRPDRVLAVDWSARSKPSPAKPTADAIFMCDARQDHPHHTTYHRTRMAAFDACCRCLDDALAKGHTTLIGFDFAFGYPMGFADRVAGSSQIRALWAWMHDVICDDAQNTNNRFQVAAELNTLWPGIGPFWGCPPNLHIAGLPHKGTARSGHGLPERRRIEQVVPSAHSVWKLFTTGAVGSQVLMGLPYLHKLAQRYGDAISFWPFDDAAAPITCVEIYPSLHNVHYLIHPAHDDPIYHIKDALQVKMVCDTFLSVPMMPNVWPRLSRPDVPFDAAQAMQEGWIFGAHSPKGGT
ncbi:MAG: hypothetical protein AAF386_04740 [Pseudomonadota bacterium]